MKSSPINFSAIILIAALLAWAAAAHAADLRDIKKLYRQKKYDTARTSLQDGLDRFKGSSYREGLLLLAKLETSADDAARLYRKVISLGRAKEALKARLELAKIYYAIGDYRGASEVLADIPARGYSQDRLEATFFRALCRNQLGETGKAKIDLNRIDRGEFLYWSYMALADIDIQEGRIENAIERYETIAGGYSNPIAGFKLGECYEIFGEREKAVEAYRTLLHQFPKSLEAPKAREKIQMIGYFRSTKGSDRSSKGGDEGKNFEEERGDFQSLSLGYTLQYGAFSEKENALRMAEELEGQARDVRVERMESGGKVWHRVRVGRFSSREEANNYAAVLLRKTGYQGKVFPLK